MTGRTFDQGGEMVRTSVKLTRDEFAAVANGTYRPGAVPRSGEPVTIVDKRGSRKTTTVIDADTGEVGSIPSTELEVARSANRIMETVDPDAPMGDQIAATVRNRTAEQLADHDRVVQNEIAKGFWRGEVVDAAQAEQRAVNTALQAALSQTLGEVAKHNRVIG
jgi:hypothetical protein